MDLLQHLRAVDKPSLLLGVATVVVGVVLKQWLPRWPTLLITLVLASLLVWLWPAMFGHVHLVSAFVGRLPPFSALPLDLDLILRLLPSAVAVGMLGLVTSLSIARSISARSQQLLDANQEVRAQGFRILSGRSFPDRCRRARSPARVSVMRRALARRWPACFRRSGWRCLRFLVPG